MQKDGKFDAKVAQEAFNWIGSIVTDETLSSPRTQEDVKNALQDGYILAKYDSKNLQENLAFMWMALTSSEVKIH